MGWVAPLRHLSAKLLSDRISSEWEPCMGEVVDEDTRAVALHEINTAISALRESMGDRKSTRLNSSH